MPTLTKHRLTRDVYAISFAADLEDGETIVSATVTVLRRRGDGTWEDVTPEFRSGEPAPGTDDDQVQVLFWLRAAAAGDQSADSSPALASRVPDTARHAVLAVALTSTGASVVAMDREARLPRLVVNGEGP